MRKALLAFVAAFVVATVSLAVRVHADVLDSVTVVVGCKNYTVKATGHGLIHPNAVVQYNWDIPTGGLGTGFGDLRVADMFPVNLQQGGTFTTSTTKAEPIPPSELVLFGNSIGFGTATLITGAMTWNTVASPSSEIHRHSL